MSNYSTLLPKTEHMTPTEPSVNTVHISAETKHLISASTGTAWFPDLLQYLWSVDYIGFTSSISITTVKIWNFHFLWMDKTGVPPSIPTAGPRFHDGSCIGGMMLAFIIILVVTLGYRLACSQREVHYRVMWVSSECLVFFLAVFLHLNNCLLKTCGSRYVM